MEGPVPPLHPTELAEARRHVPEDEAREFAARQRRARDRVARTRAFYTRYPSRMAALQMLALLGVALLRIAARSKAYDGLSDRLVPVDDAGAPRTALWREYVRAFEEGRPRDVLEERWLAAHVADMQEVKEDGFVEQFWAELAAHPGDRGWRTPAHHMAVTLGTRANDAQAIDRKVALETSMASALIRVLTNQVRSIAWLVAAHVLASARAVILGGPTVPPHLPSDRRLVGLLCLTTAALPFVGRVVHIGIKRRARGEAAPRGTWSLRPSLDAVLGPDVERLHPLVLRLFEGMAEFAMKVSVHLDHALGRWLGWAAVLLVGQGMYETDLDEVDARFDVFRRDDGSMHWVREFWCADAVRVFDSDFLVREIEGRRTFVEFFRDLGVACQMRTEVLDDGGLSMTVVRVFVRGIPFPVGPFHVRFETRPLPEAGKVVVQGGLRLAPRSGLGRWVWHRLLRLPPDFGGIRYVATPQGSTAG